MCEHRKFPCVSEALRDTTQSLRARPPRSFKGYEPKSVKLRASVKKTGNVHNLKDLVPENFRLQRGGLGRRLREQFLRLSVSNSYLSSLFRKQ